MSETCQTCHSFFPPAVVESGECVWCIAEQLKRENSAMREAIKEAYENLSFLLDTHAAFQHCTVQERKGFAALAKLQPFITQ